MLMGTERDEVCGGISQASCLIPVLFNLCTANLHDLQDDKLIFFNVLMIA